MAKAVVNMDNSWTLFLEMQYNIRILGSNTQSPRGDRAPPQFPEGVQISPQVLF